MALQTRAWLLISCWSHTSLPPISVLQGFRQKVRSPLRPSPTRPLLLRAPMLPSAEQAFVTLPGKVTNIKKHCWAGDVTERAESWHTQSPGFHA